MNTEFNDRLGAWLKQNPDERDYRQGALMLLQLNANRIMYRNITASLEKHRRTIEYHLQKAYNSRLATATRQQVSQMDAEAKEIEKKHSLGAGKAKSASGKRPDHDSLPAEIQALYVENLSLRQRMRDIHTRLRMMTTADGVCPDSDRYPFLKELIRLDKEYRANWARYDTYDGSAEPAAEVLDSREKDKKYSSLVNLNKGKYAKNPTTELGERIKSWYSQISDPSPKLTASMMQIGLL